MLLEMSICRFNYSLSRKKKTMLQTQLAAGAIGKAAFKSTGLFSGQAIFKSNCNGFFIKSFTFFKASTNTFLDIKRIYRH